MGKFDRKGIPGTTAEIPLVYGAILGWQAQVTVIDPSRSEHGCLRCLFPEPPAQQPTCAEAGIIGALAGTAGSTSSPDQDEVEDIDADAGTDQHDDVDAEEESEEEDETVERPNF